MAYYFKYRLQQAPVASQDGSGVVLHDVFAVMRPYGSPTDTPYTVVPGYHKTLAIPMEEMKIVNDMPHNNQTSKTAKVAAYKDALRVYVKHQPAVPPRDWSPDGLAAFMDVNDKAANEAQRANEFITVALGYVYPVEFSI